MQLRFRDQGQFERMSAISAARGLSMNEWVLRQVEASEDLKMGLARVAHLVLTEEVFDVGPKNDVGRGAGGDAADSSGRERNGVAVSVLQAAEGKAEGLRAVQPLRPELAGRGGFDEGPAIEPAAKECGSCEGQLRAVKGKWVCMDPACGMCGQEQGRV